jgi:predicted transcriptional regulator
MPDEQKKPKAPPHTILPHAWTDKHLRNIGGTELKVYIALLRYNTKGQGWCYPNEDKVVEESGVSRASVMRSIKILSDMGYIKVKRINRKKKKSDENATGWKNIYAIKTPKEVSNCDIMCVAFCDINNVSNCDI